MEKVKMIMDNLQPKMEYLWVVEIGDVKNEHIRSVVLPNILIKKNIFGVSSEYLTELIISIIEPMSSSYFKYFRDKSNNGENLDVTIKYLDNNGVVINKNKYVGCYITSIELGDLSYDSDGVLINRIILQPKYLENLE